jgi:predicted RNA-binding Zn-ribbon protein involved in translation (DUF1610 family)
MYRPHRPIVWLSRLALILAPILASASPVVAQPAREGYLDFRNKKPLSDAFRFGGHDPDSEMTPEIEGLRVKLPAERGQHFLSEVNVNFLVTGDFEFTATYEILTAQPPLEGYGVGVNLTVRMDTEPQKYGKLMRALRVKEGSVYIAEIFGKKDKVKYKNAVKQTEVRGGQLRLSRIGPSLYYLVSDGPAKEFELLWEFKDYGADDLAYAGFQVADSGKPGNPIDARLIDLRMRMGKVERDKITAASPLAAAAPVQAARDGGQAAPRMLDGVPRWMTALMAIGAGLLVLLVALIGVLLFMRRRKPIPLDNEDVSSEPRVVACSACGKKLKIKAESAGKKVKCPGCGKPIEVVTESRAP